ncbi:MAG: GNAT family N-acetyltransferase [Phycisphaerales bacterium]|nr:GNAT family N-acetyltransferase [Phycisphaerales bacterium]
MHVRRGFLVTRRTADTVTDRVILRDVVDADLPTLFAQQMDPEANRMAAFPARERDAFMAHWARIRIDATVIINAILFGGRVAGNIGSYERDDRRLIGYWIGREFWGRGIATAALADFLGHDRTRPLQAFVAKQNAASIRVLEKCGFTRCNVNGSASVVGDDGVEELLFSIA